ncbi:MAG TPA: SurA N-terminal domain-containing protein, partial [Anaerolineae bacterium]|nr:SurA N-terminal domain-containing protein [Anaerolineae bacterium]
RIVARVNNQPIFREAYEKQVARFQQTLTGQGVDLNGQSGQAALAQIRQQVLAAMIDQLIIEQQAARLNIIVTAQAVETEAQRMAQTHSPAQFETWLAANNLTFEEFKETLRAQLIANQIFETITSDVAETTARERVFADWLTKQRAAAIIEP